MRKVQLLLLFAFLYPALAQAQLWRSSYDSATVYWQNHEWPLAIKFLTQAEGTAKNDLGIYDPNYLTILNDLGLAYLNAGFYDMAEECLKQSKDLRKEILAPEDQELLIAHLNYTQLLVITDPHRAKQELLELVDQVPDQLPTVALQLGDIYDHSGQLDSARYWYFLPVEKGYSDLPVSLKVRQLASLREQGAYDRAIQLSASYVESATASGDANGLASILLEQGLVSFETGEYQKAEKDFLQAISLNGPVTAGSVASHNALAALYARMGFTEKALDYQKQTLQRLQPTSPAFKKIQLNLATLYAQTGEYEPALVIYQKQLNRPVGPAERLSLLINLSSLMENMGRTREADSLVWLARHMSELDKLSPSLQATLYNHAGLASLRHANFEQSVRDFMTARTIREELFGTDNPLLYDIDNNLGLAYICSEKIDEALPLIREGVEKEQKFIRYNFPILSRREKIQFYSGLKKDFDRFNSLVLTYAPQNQELINALFSKQMLLKGIMLKAVESWNNGTERDPASENLFIELQQDRQALSSLYKVSYGGEEISQKVHELEKKINTLEDQLSRSNSEEIQYHADLSWEEISAKLEPDQAVIDLIRIADFKTRIKEDHTFEMGFTSQYNYVALLLAAGEKPRLIMLAQNGKNLDERYFSFYKNSIRFNLKDTESYARYWKPLDEYLQDKAEIFVINDGVYHKINLNSLYDPATDSYLLTRYDIHLLVNPGDVLAPASEKIDIQTAYLCGDPLPTTITTPKETFRLEPLPFSKNEITSIANTMEQLDWTVDQALGKAATITNFMAHTGNSIIHVATHGFFSADLVPNSSELPDAGLLASGLVFSRDSSSTSQVLTGYEILGLDFSHTDLVVLSACETGLGEIRNGEGIDGLQRAFLGSGAKSLILSLWQVDDKATQELMVRFYQYYLNGTNKRVAFRKAQMEMLAAGYAPRFWSAFIMAGS